MSNDSKEIIILADHREKYSGVPALLEQKGAKVHMTTLQAGDYIINHQAVIERKSAEDFIQSLITDRLFNQISRLTKAGLLPFVLLEGNPFKTTHRINHAAIKGALLSIMASWQVPVIYAKDSEDSACLMLMMKGQMSARHEIVRLTSYKPKRIKAHCLQFLQGLPQIGPLLAKRLVNHFGSMKAIVNAEEKELRQVDGIGKQTAGKICEFLSEKDRP